MLTCAWLCSCLWLVPKESIALFKFCLCLQLKPLPFLGKQLNITLKSMFTGFNVSKTLTAGTTRPLAKLVVEQWAL